MRTITSFDDALDFYPDAKPRTGPRFGRAFESLRLVWEAMAEWHAAARRYHALTARGMPHDQAEVNMRLFADRVMPILQRDPAYAAPRIASMPAPAAASERLFAPA